MKNDLAQKIDRFLFLLLGTGQTELIRYYYDQLQILREKNNDDI